VFLRSVGQVKTERDAGICQPLGGRDQGFFPGGGFGHFGTVCGVLEPIFWSNYPRLTVLQALNAPKLHLWYIFDSLLIGRFQFRVPGDLQKNTGGVRQLQGVR